MIWSKRRLVRPCKAHDVVKSLNARIASRKGDILKEIFDTKVSDIEDMIRLRGFFDCGDLQ
ncbi:MAG: hypothetical protein MUO26_03635 [Methanotrichaceae archaeon]|nr:hypothetical protein [Methanotrichaceae archaeon]